MKRKEPGSISPAIFLSGEGEGKREMTSYTFIGERLPRAAPQPQEEKRRNHPRLDQPGEGRPYPSLLISKGKEVTSSESTRAGRKEERGVDTLL